MPSTFRRFLAAGTALSLALQPVHAETGFYFRNVTSAPVTAGPDTSTNNPGQEPPVKGTGQLDVFSAPGARARPGSGFALQVTSQGGTGAVTWSSTGSALPPGLYLDSSSGLITGVPTQTGSFGGILVTGTDSKGIQGTTQPISISVVPKPAVTVQASMTVAAGQQFQVTPSVTNALGSTAWSLSAPLPVGLTMNDVTGVISGRSDQAGTWSGIVLTVTDSDGASGSSQPFSVRVTSPMSVYGVDGSYAGRVGSPFVGVRPVVTGNANPVTWSLASGVLPAGLSVDASTGAVTGTPSGQASVTGLSLRATDTVTGASVSSSTFSLNVAFTPGVILTKSSYTLRVGDALKIVPVVYGLAGKGYWVLDGGSLPSGLALDSATGIVSGSPTNVGTASDLSLRVIDLFDGATASSQLFSITQVSNLQVGASMPLTGEVGQPLSVAAPPVVGLLGKATWSITGKLPSGLAVSPTTGLLSGTPQAPTSQPVTLTYRVTDSKDGTSAQGAAFTMAVVEAGTFAVSGIQPSYVAFTGKRMQVVPSVVGAQGQVTWQASALPSWASFDPATGIMSGTPSAPSSDAGLVLTATDSVGQSGSSIPFSVDAVQSVSVSYAPGPLVQGQPYEVVPAVSDAHGPLSFSISGRLPAGLAFDTSTGTISGTTYAPGGTYPLGVTVNDTTATASAPAFALSLPAQGWSASVPSTPSGKPNAPFSVTATATGFSGPVTWTLASGTLPPWATLSATSGTVTGTPTESGYFGPIVLQAADQAGHVAQANAMAIAITASPVLSASLSASAASVAATVNAPFRLVPSVTGSQGALAWSLASGTLPAWAALDPASGAITGTPDAPGTFPGIVLQVSDSVGKASTNPVSIVATRSSLQVAPVPAALQATLGRDFYLAAPRVTGSSGTLTWGVASGALPSWLRLNPEGSIGGTPMGANAVGATSGLSLQVTDGSGSSQLTNQFSVQVSRAPLAISRGPSSATTHPGLALALTAPAVDNALGKVTWSVSPALPAGLSLSPDTGIVTGTPSAVGSASYGLTATDAFDGASVQGGTFQVNVLPAPSVSTAATYTAQINIPATFRPSVTNAIGAVTWRLSAGTLPTGLSFDSNTGAISGTVGSLGTVSGLQVTATDSLGVSGTSQPFSIQSVKGIVFAFAPLSEGTFPPPQRVTVPWNSLTPAISNAVGAVGYSLASGTIPPGLSLDATTGIISGTPTQAYTGTVTLNVTDSNGSVATSPAINLAIVAAPAVTVADATVRIGGTLNLVPTIANAFPNADGYIGVTVAGGLPSWVGINSDARTYALQGKPTAVGTFPNLVMNVRDVNGAYGSSNPFTISVTPGMSVSNIAASYSGRAGRPLSPTVQPTLSNLVGTATWTASALPTGLSVDAGTGVVSGTPSGGSNATATLTATDSSDKATVDAAVKFAIAPAVSVSGANGLTTHAGIDAMTPAPAFSGLRGTAMTWSLATGTLPAWATLDPATGIISARNPTVGTTSGLSITATDNLDQASGTSAPFSLTVVPPLAIANVSTSYSAQVRVPFTTTAPNVSNAIGSVKWSVAGGTLPSWATVNEATGIISGTPDVAGTYSGLALVAQDANSSVSSAAFTLTVQPNVTVSLASSAPTGLVRVGDAYTLTPTATGLQGSPTWSMALTSGALPAGITQQPSGVVGGTVTGPGTATFTIGVTDQANGKAASSSPVTLTASPALAVSGVPDYSVRALTSLATKAPSIAGAVGTIAYSIDQAVPAGMNAFNSNSGTMSGVPTGSFGPVTYKLTATDSFDGRTANQSFKVQVFGAFAWSSQPVAVSAVQNKVYASPQPAVANAMGKVTMSLWTNGTDISSNLNTPTYCPGLQFSTTTGVISGTPTAPCGISSATVVATDAGDGSIATSNAFAILASGPTGSTAYTLPILDYFANFVAATPVTVSRLYDGSNVYKGQGVYPGMWCSGSSTCEVVMHWSEPKLWNTMMISGTANNVANGWIVYYDNGDGQWRQLWTASYEQNAGSPAGDADNSKKVTFADTVITRVRVVFQGYPGGWGHLDEWRFGYNAAPPVTVAQSLTAGYMASPATGRIRVGDNYSLTPQASGLAGTAQWSMSVTSGTLPAGITQNASTGVVSGRATGAGAATYTVNLRDSANGATTATDPITVTAMAPLAVSGVPNYVVHALSPVNGVAPTVTNAGGVVTYALDKALPTGMNAFNANTGMPSGTPTAATAAATYTLTATDAWDGRTATQQFTLQVLAAMAFTTQPANVSGSAGDQLTSIAPAVSNVIAPATKPVTYALMSGGSDISTSLGSSCAGLSFATATGVISGTPTGACSVTGLTMVATDPSDGAKATSSTFQVQVAAQGSAVTLDPAKTQSGMTLSNGNLTVTNGGASRLTSLATTGHAGGAGQAWYYEVQTNGLDKGGDTNIGFSSTYTKIVSDTGSGGPGWSFAGGYNAIAQNGTLQQTITGKPTGADTAMVAWNGTTMWVGMNGTWLNGNPSTGSGGFAFNPGSTVVYPAVSVSVAGSYASFKFKGFKYAPPAGFVGWQ